MHFKPDLEDESYDRESSKFLVPKYFGGEVAGEKVKPRDSVRDYISYAKLRHASTSEEESQLLRTEYYVNARKI